MNTENKIISWKRAEDINRGLKEAGKRTVFTNGCFDLLHAGHVKVLEAARSFGDFLFLGLNSDSSVKRLKGDSRPFNCQEDRARVAAALGCVDAVVIFEQDTPLELVKLLRPDVLVKGGDYKASGVVGAEYAGSVELIPTLTGRSTTALARKIMNK